MINPQSLIFRTYCAGLNVPSSLRRQLPYRCTPNCCHNCLVTSRRGPLSWLPAVTTITISLHASWRVSMDSTNSFCVGAVGATLSNISPLTSSASGCLFLTISQSWSMKKRCSSFLSKRKKCWPKCQSLVCMIFISFRFYICQINPMFI